MQLDVFFWEKKKEKGKKINMNAKSFQNNDAFIFCKFKAEINGNSIP